MPNVPSPEARPPHKPRVLRFWKPYGVLTQFTDPEGRPTLADYISVPGVYAAGRLDYDSEGLLLLTDSGPLIHRLTDPTFHQPKTYLAQVERIPDETALEALRQGVTLNDGLTRPATVQRLSEPPVLPERDPPIRYRKQVPTTWLQLTIHEGKKRQVRRMTAAIGHPTLRLVRISIGPVRLTGLQPGEWRELTAGELAALWRAARLR